MKELKFAAIALLAPVLAAAGPAFSEGTAYKQLAASARVQPPAAPAPYLAGSKCIYGDNSMQDYYQVSDRLKNLADSTVAFVRKDALEFDAEHKAYRIKNRIKLADAMYAEPGEDFASQDKLAGCSGSYVGKGLVLTAGHCVSANPGEKDYFENFFLVFGWRQDAENSPALTFPPEAVHTIKSVAVRALEGPTGDYSSYRDFALVALDREPAGRRPLELEAGEGPEIGSKVFTIGYPMGLAVKINDPEQARIYTADKNGFLTNIDAFGGNSGGPALDSATGRIIGVLVTARGTEFSYELSGDLTFTADFSLPADELEIKPELNKLVFGSPVRTLVLGKFRNIGASISLLEGGSCRITLPKGTRLETRDPLRGWITALAGIKVFEKGRLVRDSQDSFGTGVMRVPAEIKALVLP